MVIPNPPPESQCAASRRFWDASERREGPGADRCCQPFMTHALPACLCSVIALIGTSGSLLTQKRDSAPEWFDHTPGNAWLLIEELERSGANPCILHDHLNSKP